MILLQLTIHPSIFTQIPDFKLGILYYNKTTVSASPQMLKGRLQLFQEQLYFELLDKELTDFPGIAEWQSIWRTLGADPTNTPSILETLIKRIKAHEYTSSFHSAEDLNTFFSLQYEIPTTIYDTDKIAGNIQLSIGTAEDGYVGLNNQFNNFYNLLLLSDDYSPFGSPHVDSIRTAVTEETENVLQLLFLRPSLDATEAEQLTEACGKMFTSINGGNYISRVLHAQIRSCMIENEVKK
ncbi:B3/B4 domain-containing protein [Sporosarcina obsidiansis]|uniref:B3/B4 domain-containing protein n=1 Tax=Sporosarcina obsidiansis TaxID=2660748 RepID=UPI001E2EE217|nr:phenylalanine--tRNA ligase beta subunit-related protein [Sporosarcina obsidiansis]